MPICDILITERDFSYTFIPKTDSIRWDDKYWKLIPDNLGRRQQRKKRRDDGCKPLSLA